MNSSAALDTPRASLSSLQIGVISRMRDRPPLYETRHNYQTRTSRDRQRDSSSGGVDNPVLEVNERSETPQLPSQPPRPLYVNTPPPPYVSPGGDSGSAPPMTPRLSVLRADPPPYSVAVKEEANSNISNNSNISIINPNGGGHSSAVQMPRNDLGGNLKELYI